MSETVSVRPARRIDHVVLPVVSLDDARTRYTALGFNVGPNGVHPFGTENANIYLPDGTFLEPLAIASRETCWEEAKRGNPFVRNDQTYRFRVSGEGFSHTVVTTEDAEDDYHRYGELGFGDGPIVSFVRLNERPNGEHEEVGFKLAFAADDRSPDAKFFSCETEKAPTLDGPRRQHPNGAVRLKRIVISEPNPTDFQYFLQEFLQRRDVSAHSFGMDVEAANATVEVLTPEGLRAHYALDADPQARGMRHRAFVVGVDDLDVTRRWLADHEIEHVERNGRLLVPSALGQGCTVGFEAA